MKTHTLLISALTLVFAATASAQKPADKKAPTATLSLSSRTIEMKPSEKRPLEVKDSEINPYAKRAPEEEEVVETGEDTQENKIRAKLLSMPVGGQSRSTNGIRLLVGDLILEKGKVVDQLIPDQTEHLLVLEVTENVIKFGWLDIQTGELTGKTMPISYDISAGRIRRVLPGQSPELIAGGDPEMTIIDVNADRKRAAAEYQKINPKNRIPAMVYERAQ